MSIVNLSTLTENNGLPVFINNLNKHHSIPLMSSVSIKNDPEGDNPSINADQFFVVAHTRDCDGSPLYHIANTNFKTAISLAYILRTENQQSNVEIAKLFNKLHLLNTEKTHFLTAEDFLKFHDFTKTFLFRNYSEESLFVTQTL